MPATLLSQTLTFSELLTLMLFLGGIVTVWITANIKIAKLETSLKLGLESLRCEVDIKLKSIESKTIGMTDFVGARVTEFVADNKDDHNEIKVHIETIKTQITALSVQLAKK